MNKFLSLLLIFVLLFQFASFATFQNAEAQTQDNSPPTLNIPDDIVQETAAELALVIFSVSAHDDKDGKIIPVCSHKKGDKFPVGKHTVTCTATDLAGNTVTKTFTITIKEWEVHNDNWPGVEPEIYGSSGEIGEPLEIPEPEEKPVIPSHQKTSIPMVG